MKAKNKIKYKMPTKSDLKARSSTISNAFAVSIAPYIHPSEMEVNQSYKELEIENGQCAYCLQTGAGKDHLRPLVTNGMPTGYITNINNLVPCCNSCNSSKGAKNFTEWYLSKDNLQRLHTIGLTDELIKKRFEIILRYEQKIGEPINYKAIVGDDLWEEFNSRRKELIRILNENQEFCNMLNKIIMKKLYSEGK